MLCRVVSCCGLVSRADKMYVGIYRRCILYINEKGKRFIVAFERCTYILLPVWSSGQKNRIGLSFFHI
jgi:hypothetical protein